MIVRTGVKLLCIAGGCVLASCASTPAADSDVDYARVTKIERAAKSLGTQVVWINYPRKNDSAK